tara:strand:+ start:516 stop:1484 length:969 start_codon:yes stop_codon:yes gene_type:complete
MIISQTPFRISLFGGSTDYESFYSKYGSFIIGFTIDKYCYLCVRKTPKIFNYKTKLGYSRIEIINNHKDIKHDGIRGVLKFLNIKYGIEISHLSDLPSKTGMGSSSAFVVGLLNALHSIQHEPCTKQDLAKEAIYVERQLLNESGGIQDQIWSAYGGFNCIDIKHDGSFEVKPLPVSDSFIENFLKRSVVIYTGNDRNSFKIAKSYTNDRAKNYQKKIAAIAKEAYRKFEQQDIDSIGQLLDESWQCKKNISDLISSDKLDQMYQTLKDDGVIGAKLLGAGGSGFMFGILDSNVNKKDFKKKYRTKYVDINIDTKGSLIINE